MTTNEAVTKFYEIFFALICGHFESICGFSVSFIVNVWYILPFCPNLSYSCFFLVSFRWLAVIFFPLMFVTYLLSVLLGLLDLCLVGPFSNQDMIVTNKRSGNRLAQDEYGVRG